MNQPKKFDIEFSIEDGIPIPKNLKLKVGKWDALPLEQMKIGQNVLLEKCTVDNCNIKYKRIYWQVWKVLRVRSGDMKFKVGMVQITGKKDVDIRLFRVK